MAEAKKRADENSQKFCDAVNHAASQTQPQGGIGYATCTADRDAGPHARLVDRLRSEVCMLDEKVDRHRDMKELLYLVEQNPAMARMLELYVHLVLGH